MVRSHVAIITNVLPVHVGNFADGEIGIANAKAEIFEGVEPGGVAILPGDSLHALLLTGNARRAGARVVTFGRGEGADVRAVEIAADGDRSRIVADAQGAKIAYRLGAPGAHLAENSLAVAAALHVLAIAPDRALGALAQIAAGPGRGQRITFRAGAGRVLLIDESYNANPASMAAAIRTAAGARQGGHKRLVVALGDMLELGADAGRHHTDLAPVLDAAGADVIFGCGPNMKLLFDALPTAKRGAWAETSAGLVDVVPQALQAGDVVMVKGSLGSRMAPIVDAIKKRFAAEGGSV
jgi:UDP-N-acetylmuramoyl-tripeptide--D-alanyl-D-alanine ligase